MNKPKVRRQQLREKRARSAGTWKGRVARSLFSWRVLAGALFVVGVSAISLLGERSLRYSIGQRVDHPVYARVGFQVPDAKQTAADREAARAATPSYYSLNPPALTFDRIRADLMRLYQAAVDAETYEEFKATVEEQLKCPADTRSYERLRALGDEGGRAQFQAWVQQLPLEQEYVVRDLLREPRVPRSTTDFIRVALPGSDGRIRFLDVPHAELVPHRNERALRGSAASVARKFPLPELRPAVEAIVFSVFREQPTLVYDQERTVAAMRKAEEATPVAMTTYEKGKPFIEPGVIGSRQYELLRAHHAAYLKFLNSGAPEAASARQAWLLERIGLVALVAMLSVGLLMYTDLYHPRIFEIRTRTVAFGGLLLGCFLAVRMLDMKWPQLPELTLAPCLFATSVLAIVYPRRLAVGAMAIVAVIVATTGRDDVNFLLTLLIGVAVAGHHLDEIRSRMKLPSAGFVTALAVMSASLASGLMEGHSLDFLRQHALWGAACAIAPAFVVSGILPFIERIFRVATSLTLLEWRDPTRPLLQLLAREAPGTYSHSLVVGTLAEAACDRIGANSLLAQVGALYHDIGKIPKADYFTENQQGQISRHANLAPTMSLLIILGHVKDGIEMAKEYKLPRVLHQFIEEHHGTTVVRYFHHVASEKQPRIASGRHDREVPEAEFRYGGPKPRTRESAVLMLADGVEGAVRSLQEPTPGRIESVVHQVVTSRLNDGQFDDCEITLRQIHQVEDSLVKSLCGIYHGRVAYPAARKPPVTAPIPQRVSV